MAHPELIRVYDGTPVPYSEGQLRLDVKPARAPSGRLPDDFLAQYNCYRPRMLAEPQTDDLSVAIINETPELIDSVWSWTWRVEDVSLTLKQAKMAMTRWIDGLTAQIEGEYPRVVQKGWEGEEAMARAHKAGTATQEQADMLAADAAAKGRTPTEHADRIVEKADRFRAIMLDTRRLWLATDKALEEVSDPADYPGILRAAKAQAAPIAQAYGLSP
ncbi:hypothetical protein [Roseovarius ramblicola]|uniref:Uncharacterized protein n=1 Tax=Roseovarius ramblicola TaxID=2022336 RepID=A0ABV5I4T6_9RHOB